MLKTKYIIIVTLILISIQLNAQESFIDDTTSQKMSIKSITKKTYRNDSINLIMINVEYYTPNGKLSKRSTNNQLNSSSYSEYFSYNDKGQLVKKLKVHNKLNDSIVETYSFSYNSMGQLDSSLNWKIKYKYDIKRRVVERIEKTSKTSILKTIYSYNTLGQLVSEEKFLNTKKTQKRIWKYNNQGQIIMLKRTYFEYIQKDVFISEFEDTFVYNENGLLVTEYQKHTINNEDALPADKICTYEYVFY